MGRITKNNLVVLLVFILLTVFVFRNYFFRNQIPFPANLLVSFYAPWRYETWEGYPNGPPNKPIGFDVLKLFYPFRKFTIEQLKNGQWPLWNPYNFSGNVHLATYQSAVFYPLNFIYFLPALNHNGLGPARPPGGLPLIDAWSILVIIQPILAGFFTYLFLKEIKLSQRASFFGAIVFAFSGWMLAWMEESLVIEHSALWLPLILLSIEKVFKKKKKWFFLLIFGLVSSILAGFLQMTIYGLLTALAWIFYRWWQDKKRSLKELTPFVMAFIFSFLLSAVHLIPAFEAYFYSPRGVVGARFLFESYLMPPWHLITFLAPDFWGNPGAYNYFGSGFYHEKIIFIGIPGLLLAFYGFFIKSKERNLKFFRWFSLITLALGFFPFGWIWYFSRLPILSTMIPSRIFFLSSFGFSVLASFGMDAFLKHKKDLKIWRDIFTVIFFVFLILWLFVFLKKLTDPLGNYAKVSFRNLILPTGFFIGSVFLGGLRLMSRNPEPEQVRFRAGLSRYNLELISYIGLVGLSLLSSFYFANKFLYFSERRFVFPEVPMISKLKEIAGINRIWGYGNAYMEKNMNIYYGLYSPEGYDALYSQRYGELMHTQETNGRITDQILRTDANIKQASERESVLDNWQRRRLLSLLGVKYIMEAKVGDDKDLSTTEKRFPETDFSLAWEDDKFRIWEYKEALPRAFLVNDYVVEQDRQKIADYLFDPDFELDKRIVLEEDPVLINNQQLTINNPGEVEILSYTPNEVKLKTNTPTNALLFLSDNYYPGWKAYVDDKETKIYRADYSFRAVAVPAGSYEVRFSYEQASFAWGLRISVISLLLILLVVLRREIFR